ncbi:MAG: AI-2E family transporter [Gammaproteobacteria bacterium]|nr:AI-2E family transporter [Gammaproteobacteria bacterium]
MLSVLKEWYERHFSDPQVIILALMLIGSAIALFLFGNILAPVLVALILAYLLEGIVSPIVKLGIPRNWAVTIVMLVFLVLFWGLAIGLIPVLSRQVSQLIADMPSMISKGQGLLLLLPEMYPAIFTEEQIQNLFIYARREVGEWGQAVLTYSVANVINVFTLIVYAVLIPLMIFFGLKDKQKIFVWVRRFMPSRRALIIKVWREVDDNIANYIRGKIIEIMIVWIVTYVTFALMGLNFSLLLSFLVGISVIIPFIGAITVTIPIALIAFFQWGLTAQFGYLLLAYQVIQILDGNVLVPVLFSEVVNIHPLAIIIAVVFFGGIWGIWGVFFAIPLATVVQAILNTWPKIQQDSEGPVTQGNGQ